MPCCKSVPVRTRNTCFKLSDSEQSGSRCSVRASRFTQKSWWPLTGSREETVQECIQMRNDSIGSKTILLSWCYKCTQSVNKWSFVNGRKLIKTISTSENPYSYAEPGNSDPKPDKNILLGFTDCDNLSVWVLTGWYYFMSDFIPFIYLFKLTSLHLFFHYIPLHP